MTNLANIPLSVLDPSPDPIKPPVENMDKLWNAMERKSVDEQLFTSIIVDPIGIKQ